MVQICLYEKVKFPCMHFIFGFLSSSSSFFSFFFLHHMIIQLKNDTKFIGLGLGFTVVS